MNITNTKAQKKQLNDSEHEQVTTMISLLETSNEIGTQQLSDEYMKRKITTYVYAYGIVQDN